ncbi:predicted protein [Plenodomus lingam JN3]|uniref:Predicted protein n=1 Tax=Leptosphaeria maculans (strain JN3 / isolate v23.1.3 / race Av1-4-5-6-7-8) TaxID=985895 RepID=E4ZWR9_LEPMJ|nr:predicted protein [Plenodomus lingam JN3]CBX96045.1 predicted protein [Plenodomus lingam JN3]
MSYPQGYMHSPSTNGYTRAPLHPIPSHQADKTYGTVISRISFWGD